IKWGIGKIAMQLAMYANSLLYDIGTGQRERHNADKAEGIIIHLPAGAGECTLHRVDLTAGWEAVQLATQVREWRKRKDLSAQIVDQPTLDEGSDALADAIASAATVDQLNQLWATRHQEWTPQHIELAGARKA